MFLDKLKFFWKEAEGGIIFRFKGGLEIFGFEGDVFSPPEKLEIDLGFREF